MTSGIDDPTTGARRREGLLLVGFVLVSFLGVWTVVAAELGADDPATTHPQNVTAATENSK